ncbi:TLC domain-containing protein [Citrus sinensis]|nr:uncharacterized protein LOC102620842 isoform X2 [Citrus sinensis]KAH9705999.1 TLC domain-containing protein [Citrus sinensis]
MEVKSYQSQAESLLKEYILADPFVPYTSIVGSIFACKMVYDLAQLISAVHFKSYSSFSNIQRVEWSNRAISTVHAIFITAMSLYFVFWSDLFLDNQLASLITFRSAFPSTFTLGVSVGYFLADLGMIIWFYPALGGMEYVIHHLLSIAATACAMLTGEAQFYTYMVLISETTTPGINLRWYLDKAGMKRSRAYLINGILMFLAWLVVRILFFMYIFYHIYLHVDQVKQCRTCVQILVFSVPVVLFIMNAVWFSKIVKGLVKTLAKQQ